MFALYPTSDKSVCPRRENNSIITSSQTQFVDWPLHSLRCRDPTTPTLRPQAKEVPKVLQNPGPTLWAPTYVI